MAPRKGSVCVGIMSGTSVDGIDVAVTDIYEESNNLAVDVLHFETFDFPEEVRKLVFQLFRNENSSVEALCDINFLLGELFADAVLRAVQHAGINRAEIDLVSSHGQTIFHSPEAKNICGHWITSTLQIGESAVLAEKIGCPVVSDFRVRDMAAGGQGAPLVPYVDALLFASHEGRILVNIGGIANLTYLPSRNSTHPILAFDTGPGNMIIDGLVRHFTHEQETYDRDGMMAQSGQVNDPYLQHWLTQPYLLQAPPKSTGRELFGEQCVAQWVRDGEALGISPADLVATATEFTIRSLAQAVKRFVLAEHEACEILVGGGGAYNPVIMAGIRRELTQQSVFSQDVTGISSASKEAVAFALLGYQCFHRRPNNVPSATGAKHPVTMGKITWP